MEENVQAGPSAAERIRTLVDGNATGVLDIPGIAVDAWALVATDRGVDADGAVRLRAPLRVVEEVAAVLEITDVAPVAVPHRVRGRARVAGWLTPGPEEGLLRLETAEATIDDLWGTDAAEPEELAAAAPDPLAAHEAEILQHLAAAHGDRLASLARLVPREYAGARAVPVALDRFGLRVRYVGAQGAPIDARFDFAAPVSSPAALRAAMSSLLAAAAR